jgi:DNA-binding protein HU-beta
LILAGQGAAASAQLVLAELAGMLIASVFITIFADKVAAKKAEAVAEAPKAVAKKAPAKTVAKKAPAKKK